MKFQMAITFLTGILIAGCQKKDDVTADAAKVNMQISAPLNGQTFHANDTVHIKANVDYPSELHGYEVKIEDTATGTIVYDETQHVHSDKFVIDDTWVGSVSQPTELKLTILTYIDHDNNSAQKVIWIKMAP